MLRSPPRYSDPTLAPLDEADRKLIAMLASDGRASGRDLAQQTGISEANVSRRLARLIEERSVRIVGFVPPACLGLSVQFSAYLRVRGDIDAAAAEILKHPEFTYVSASFGEWDLILGGVVSDAHSLVALLDRALMANPLFHGVESRIVLEYADAGQSQALAGSPAADREVDRTDRQIIRHVQNEGRISFTDIAQHTGISATSAADRFRRLVADRVVRILTLPDPARVSLNLSGIFSVTASRPSRDVTQALAAMPEISFLCVTTGTSPVQGEFQVRDGAHFDELRARIMGVPGVTDVKVSLLRKLYRHSFAWGTADAG
ncbi:MAG: Lrp/AsnC family transcriptional regulator [Proteobacteria bacterium]|nr:Lrp/AsnC family transcriptional regulator [Pseudomonadota bacterium]